MIKKYVKMAALLVMFSPFSANADVLLKDNSEILGKWNLYAEAIKLEGDRKELKVEWDFQPEGILQTKADSGGRTSNFNIAVKYSVENGLIKKQSAPGREKYENCEVITKQDKEMTLHCSQMYFFLKKL